jgi:hypothetical protein
MHDAIAPRRRAIDAATENVATLRHRGVGAAAVLTNHVYDLDQCLWGRPSHAMLAAYRLRSFALALRLVHALAK